MPTRLCSEPHCADPAHYRGRCSEHANSFDRSINRAGQSIYRTKRWQRTRAAVLLDEPDCRSCGAPAEHIDHIRDLADGGDAWARGNLQPLCASCHGRKTRQGQATP